MILRKSCNFLDGNDLTLLRALANWFELSQGSLLVRYLNLPLMLHNLRLQDYQFLNVLERISWTIRRFSLNGSRLKLIQYVLCSILNFWAAVFPHPKACIKETENICNVFLWSNNSKLITQCKGFLGFSLYTKETRRFKIKKIGGYQSIVWP